MEAIYGEMEVESCYTLLELPSPKKKRKNKGMGISDKPKKPRSAYLLYYFDVRQSMQQEHPDLPQSQMNKYISDSWKRLNVADRGFYLEKARQERDGVHSIGLSGASSQDVPGFRKILPRANLMILPKNSTANLGSRGLAELGDTTSLCDNNVVGTSQEPQQANLVAPISLGSEVELCEQSVAIQTLSEETGLSSVLSQNSTHKEANLTEESGVMVNGRAKLENGTEMKADATHLVAIFPNQSLLENKVINTSSPIVMFPVMKSIKPETKLSFKLPIKYTRRGRGNCPTPGCVFSYVTRHKPPQCPACGQHLGGKWVAPVKRISGKGCDASAVKPQVDLDRPVILPERVDVGQTTSVMRRVRRKKKESENPAPKSDVILSTGSEIQPLSREKSSSAGQIRRIRSILPAPVHSNSSALLHWIPVANSKTNTHVKASSSEQILSLKPSTLRQLGHMITANTSPQKPVTSSSNQYIITENGGKILSMVPYKKPSGSSLSLGLSTARGRGHCKNPACDYIYKNRHKPQRCPTCGFQLSNKPTSNTKDQACAAEEGCSSAVVLDQAQKEQQRHSTISLLRLSLQYPESESEMQDVLSLVQQLNICSRCESDVEGTEEAGGAGWPSVFQPTATHCSLCHFPLLTDEHSGVAGFVECWLLTECLIRRVTVQQKVCMNLQCLAIHSFTDLHPGVFNVGNKLLVTLDLFFRMRKQIRHGEEPAHAALSFIRHSHSLSGCVLSSEQESELQDLFCSGYWAFECLTVRDYNDMICGICGIAPKLQIAQRNTNNVLMLKNVEFTWPEFEAEDEVHVDEFWLTMENEALEQAAFPSSIPITRFDASIIAPFIPPLMRKSSVINTEKDKLSRHTPLRGDPSVLVRLIHEGILNPEELHLMGEEELRDILEKCGIPFATDEAKQRLLELVSLLVSQIQHGLWTAPEPDSQLTAGTISQVCPHQVVCGSKYVVRRESARDHLDLLLSTRFWPPVYVTDCAQQVALCTDLSCPELASQMWGKNQGCFSDPTSAPEYVSCSDLQDQPYSLDLCTNESSPLLHPLTRSLSRWVLQPTRPTDPPQDPYAMTLCRELEPYATVVHQISHDDGTESAVTSVRRKAVAFDNAAYYYLYNRLIDFLSSRDVVNQQIADVLGTCQHGEVVMIRDALYRLGVAQINSEEQEEQEVKDVQGEQEVKMIQEELGDVEKTPDHVILEEVLLI